MQISRSSCRSSVRSGRLRPSAIRLRLLCGTLLVFFLLVASIEAEETSLQFEYGSTKENQTQIDALTKQLADHPQDVDALVARGLAYYAVRDFERGDADVAKAIELEPKNPRAWHARGRGWAQSERLKEGIAAFDRAIDLDSADPELYLERGITYGLSGDNKKALADYGQAIEIDATYADAYSHRADLLNKEGEWRRAQADYEKAIELEPKELSHRIYRAVAYFEHEEFDRGFADVQDAMRLNPGDVGVDYQPSSDKELSAEALQHGEEQVRQMLKDRPAMAEHVTPGDKLWVWATRKFAGEDLGSLIDWNAGLPPLASHVYPRFETRNCYIQIAPQRPKEENNAPREFADLWSSAVFELYNATAYREFANIEEQAGKGQLTRDEYVLAILNAEELATHRRRAFFIKFVVPWFKSQKLPLGSPYYWGCTQFHTAGDPRTDLEAWGGDSRIRWYEACYDIACAQREFDRGDYAAARRIVSALLEKEDSLTPDCQHDVYYRLGCIEFAGQKFDAAITELVRAIQAAPERMETCNSYCVKGDAEFALSNVSQAIDSYAAALRLDPKSVDALTRRSWALAQRGELEAAIQDVDAAIQLQPQEASLFVYRGNFWIDKRDYSRAVEDFTRAIELAPDRADGYRGRANANYDRGETDAALADWNAAIVRSADEYSLFVERGSLHQAKRNLKLAWDDYSAAIKLEPDQPEGYAYRAELTLLDDAKEYFRPDEAFADAQRACEITKWKSATELALLAKASAAKHEFKEAVKWQHKALENAEPLARRQALTDLEKYRRQQQTARKK